MPDKPAPGAILWRDLTVPDAGKIKDFYCKVIGWKAEANEMGEFNDYELSVASTSEVVAGVCHSRGDNSGLPSVWLVYVAVSNLDASLKLCKKLGGRVVDGPRDSGDGRFCVIQDPAGAYLALME